MTAPPNEPPIEVSPGILRTPEARFENLPGYAFNSRYVDLDGIRMHFLDQGQGEAILCLHGEPTWSYLYRTMIPILASSHRVVAPDFIGFGKSDKYADRSAYTFRRHLDQLRLFLRRLYLRGITLVCQDWGGLLGLSLVGESPDSFYRLVIMNTFLPVGEPLNEAFIKWRAWATSNAEFSVGRLLARAVPGLPPEVAAAYDAPFPEERFKAGARAFPMLVPLSSEDPGVVELRRAREVLASWTKPALVLFSNDDPITSGAEKFFCSLIPSCKEPVIIRGGGHFLQESRGPEIAGHIAAFIRRTPPPQQTRTFQPVPFW